MAHRLNITSTLHLLLPFFILPGFLPAQVMPDQIWLHGINDFPDQPGYGNAFLKFENGLDFIIAADLRMNFESTTAVMPDTLGNILFYTNGCYIANADGDTMPNGAGINPGELHDWTCPTSGYISPLGAMILQTPESPNLYYLFHMGVKYGSDRKLSYGPFYYTVVDLSLGGGKGEVVSKNNIVADGSFEPFVAVRHGNGRDWWLVFPEYGTNKYHKYLFTSHGIQAHDPQQIGQALDCRYIGSSAFSPNGARYARQQHCGVVAMDFDRCSGQFSNDRYMPLPPNAFGGGGVAFDKDGNRLFVSTQLSIQEADLTQSAPVLDTIVGWLDVVGSSLHLMQYAPNGKIYLSNLGRGKFYHVLNTPDEQDIGFVQRGLTLSKFTVRSLPNNPFYRLYDMPGSLCDTLGINAPLSNKAPAEPSIVTIQPNPVATTLYLQSAEKIIFAGIYDAAGQAKMSIDGSGKEQITIDVSQIPAGLYMMLVKTGTGVWSGKFVKL